MKFGYTIVYVPDVAASLDFFKKTFDFARRFLHESGTYGELESGATKLSFTVHTLGAANMPAGYIPASTSKKPLGMEVAFVTPDVVLAHATAVAAGARELKPPEAKPWGQTVSYLMYAAPMARWSNFAHL